MTLAQSASLTPEQIRVAVAERLGKCTHGPMFWTREGTDGDMELICTVCKRARSELRYPDYPNDLNACAEMEATLTHEQGVRYRLQLSRNSDGPKATFLTVEAAMCHANALQRCRAFLAVTSEVTENRNE